MVKTYDPKALSVICGNAIITGFSDNTALTVKRLEAMFNLKVGVDGEGTRAKSNNKGGSVEFVLMQSSGSNEALSEFAAADEAANAGKFPLLIRDESGTSLYTAASAWVKQYPDSEFAKEVGTRTWTIETDELLVFVGSNS